MATRNTAPSIFGGVDLTMLFGEGPVVPGVPKQPVQVGYGKATFETSSITLAAFVVEPDFNRTLASKKLGKMGRTISIPVSRHPDIDGWLYSECIDAPEGTVLLIQTSVKHRGVKIRDGSIFIKTRTDGEAMLITAKIPHDPRCTLTTHNHTVFSGCGDILGPEELAADGIEVPKNYVNGYMDLEEIYECYDIVQIAPAKRALPQIINEKHIADSGEEVVLKVERTNRRMRIRR